jgi:hypothetical protein
MCSYHQVSHFLQRSKETVMDREREEGLIQGERGMVDLELGVQMERNPNPNLNPNLNPNTNSNL